MNETDYDRERFEELVWRQTRAAGLSRRRFVELIGVAGAGALLGACGDSGSKGAAPAPGPQSTSGANPGGWVKPVTEDTFILRSTNAEMRWEQMRNHGYTTPNELFFIRNHTTTPRIDRAAWRLRVAGTGVAAPLELSYDDLLTVPAETRVTRFVDCAGNGRVFFSEVGGQMAKGNQWRLGAIGVAEWTGVPLGAVLERAKVKRSARDVMPEGLDDRRVRRPLPLAKAMADDTLLVYAMNGEELPPDHGAPVRALVPGWVGVANVKWVSRVEVSEQPLFSEWNTTSYVLVGPSYAAQGPSQGPVIGPQVVQSALELPWPATLPGGNQTLHGRSWSGAGMIARVEVRIDQGPFRAARLEDPNEPMAWVRWSFGWEATPGAHTVSVRATDTRGNVQPDRVPFNEQGYLYGSVVAHPVTVA
ncbi:MAG: molybdopterin-dependent oxidoreductase [Pseudonocardiaceae bacterium]